MWRKLKLKLLYWLFHSDQELADDFCDHVKDYICKDCDVSDKLEARVE